MNQREEQRVIEALQAITGGLTVTEHDIVDAGTRLQHNLNATPPRRNRALLAAAAAVVLIVAGIAAIQAITGDEKSAPPADQPPSPAEALTEALAADPYVPFEAEFLKGTPPTAQTLAGLWFLRLDEGQVPDDFRPAPMYVDGDGDYRIGVPTEPLGYGPSILDADTWTRRLDERAQCAKNNEQVGFYDMPSTAVLASDGSLHVKLTRDTGCTISGAYEVWDRVAPGAPVMDYLKSVSSEIEWRALSAEDPEGVYVAPETGHMLIVHPNGTYRYFDNLTAADLVDADSGDFDVDAQGTLAGTCGGGTFAGPVEVGPIPGVDGYLQPLSAMRITTAENGCGSDVATEGVWVKLFTGFTGNPYRE